MGKSRQGLIYQTFRAYLRFIHDKFFYRKVYRIDTENIPSDGKPVLIVSNHQNCLCDPLGVVVAFKDRKPSVLTRADIFAIHPLVDKIVRKMGLLPAYRLMFDGEESLGKNKEVFNVSGRELVGGHSILIYPEGVHQDKHWLGDFSLGYTKMAFEAAELDGFQTEIFILPCCNHYSDYYDIQKDVLLKFGAPISLEPYYELYKSKPRTAQRQVNALVREQMNGMMLNITDLDNYDAINFLRNTYGRKDIKSNALPDLLQSDRVFIEKLEDAKIEDASTVQQIYDDALVLESELKRLKIDDDNFENTPGWGSVVMSIIMIVILFPLWLFSLLPNILIYKAPDLLMHRVKDKMFYNSFLFGMSALITMPILYTISFVIALMFVNYWIAVAYALLLPHLGLFAWYYHKYMVKTWRNIRFLSISKSAEVQKNGILRSTIYEKLNNILKIR